MQAGRLDAQTKDEHGSCFLARVKGYFAALKVRECRGLNKRNSVQKQNVLRRIAEESLSCVYETSGHAMQEMFVCFSDGQNQLMRRSVMVNEKRGGDLTNEY